MWESIWEALVAAGITIPEGVTEVGIRMPGGEVLTAEVPEDLLETDG